MTFCFPTKILQKHDNGDEKGSEQASGITGHSLIPGRRGTLQSSNLSGGLVLWIYIEILHIFYIYFFLSQYFKGPPCTLLRARPCLRTPPTNYWQGLDDGSLTCTLIGRPLELRLCGITLDDLKRGGGWEKREGWGGRTRTRNGALCRGPTQSENWQIYFNFEKKHKKQCT